MTTTVSLLEGYEEWMATTDTIVRIHGWIDRCAQLDMG